MMTSDDDGLNAAGRLSNANGLRMWPLRVVKDFVVTSEDVSRRPQLRFPSTLSLYVLLSKGREILPGALSNF